MKSGTDLETLIRHLAGRLSPSSPGRASGADPLGRRLADPTSDESQFFDEIRRKTRSLLDDPAEVHPAAVDRGAANGPIPAAQARSARRRSVPGWLVLGIIASGGLVALGSMIGASLARTLAARPADQSERILAELRPLIAGLSQPGPTPAGSGPSRTPSGLDARLAALGAQLVALQHQVEALALPPPVDRAVPKLMPMEPATTANPAAIAADLAAIRRELVSSEAATTRQIQEMRTIMHELNSVVRRVLGRPQPAPGGNISSAILAVAVQALIHNLQNPSAQVRGEAVEQLVRIGAPARSALPALQQRLAQESDQNIRTAIETALSVLSSN